MAWCSPNLNFLFFFIANEPTHYSSVTRIIRTGKNKPLGKGRGKVLKLKLFTESESYLLHVLFICVGTQTSANEREDFL